MSFIQVVNHILLWLKTHHPHHDDLGLHRPRNPALQPLLPPLPPPPPPPP